MLEASDSGSENANFDTLKINEAFAARFEHNERRKMLEKNKHLLEKDGQEESSSSSSEDDSEAELLNPRVE